MATDYFIDFDTGGNGDDGLTAGNAWLTEAYALTQMTSGDTLKYVKVYYDGGATDSVLSDWEALADGGMITAVTCLKNWAITTTINAGAYERFGRYANGEFWLYHAASIDFSAIAPASARSSQDLVTHSATNYTCILPHTAIATTEPGVGATWTNYWAQEGAGGAAWSLTTVYDCRIDNGTMINPDGGGSLQGYDTIMGSNNDLYDASLNVALDETANGDTFPLTVNTESSICSTQSYDASQQFNQVLDASVLTIVDTVPDVGDFRPPYCGSDKTSNYNVSAFAAQDVYNSILANLDVDGDGIANTATQATAEARTQRVWLSHMTGNYSRFQHPENNMPDYHSDICDILSKNALWLHTLWDDAEKKTVLTYYCQIGIDFYGVMVDAGANPWANNKGSGRKWPIIFAGIVFDDSNMYNVDAAYGFYMDRKTFYVAASDVKSFPYAKTTTAKGDRWGNYHTTRDPYVEYLEYTLAVQDGMPEFGINHLTTPDNDGAGMDSDYRYLMNPYLGELLAAIITNYSSAPNAPWGRALWADESCFEYCDRYEIVGIVGFYDSQWLKDMWDEYRADYSPYYTTSFDITAAATPTAIAEVSKSYNQAVVSWSGTAAAFDISVDQSLAYLNVTSPYTITGITPSTAHEVEVWGKKANGIRSIKPDELTVTTNASPLSLLIYLKCDDNAADTVVADSSGNNFTGTLSGGDNTSAKSEQGKVGRALHLNGSDDRISIPDSPAFDDFSTSMTAAAWIKIDATTGADQVIVGHYKKKSDNRAWSFNVTNGLKLRLFASDDGTFDPGQRVDAPTDDVVITTGTWHHVAFTWDAGTLLFYVDGENVLFTDAYAGANAVDIVAFYAPAQHIWVGSSDSTVPLPERFLDGLIDDIRLYTETLSPNQIKGLLSTHNRRSRRRPR